MNFPRGCRGVVHNCRSMLFLWFAQDGPTTVWLCCVSRGMDPQLPLSRSLRLHPSGRCLRWEMLRGCWCWYVFLCCDNACEFILTCQGVTVRHSHLPLPSVVSECFGMATWSRKSKRKRRTAVPFWHIRQWQYSMRMSVFDSGKPWIERLQLSGLCGSEHGTKWKASWWMGHRYWETRLHSPASQWIQSYSIIRKQTINVYFLVLHISLSGGVKPYQDVPG